MTARAPASARATASGLVTSAATTAEVWRTERVGVRLAGDGGDLVTGGQRLPNDLATGGAVGPEDGEIHEYRSLTIRYGSPRERH